MANLEVRTSQHTARSPSAEAHILRRSAARRGGLPDPDFRRKFEVYAGIGLLQDADDLLFGLSMSIHRGLLGQFQGRRLQTQAVTDRRITSGKSQWSATVMNGTISAKHGNWEQPDLL
jgi:hypothetical protein